MSPVVSEWLNLFIRWMHVIAGIMWIGSSIFFNWLDSHLTQPEVPKAGVEGELWMVHSGGFYQVEKKLVALDKMPKTLHWFKWEAAFTWLSGFLLLCVVYYLGGGIYLVDANVSSITPGAATALGIGLLVVAWFAYDLLWLSPLPEKLKITTSCGSVFAIAFGLSHVLSGRAAYLHVGALLGTLMATNVWVRIIPAQKNLVASTQAGTKPDATLAKKAKQRSRHNNYMTYPVIFIMLSNHFPATYGSSHNWAILIGLMLLGSAVRHFQNTGDRSPKLLLGLVGLLAALALAVAVTTSSPPSGPSGTSSSGSSEPGAAALAVPPGVSLGGPPAASVAGSVTLRGVVRFAGTPPAPEAVAIPSNCAPDQTGPTFANTALIRDGKLQNAFVWIRKGLENYAGEAPKSEVLVDQRGCIYRPRVVGVRVGQPVTFLNSDPVFHNVHAGGGTNAEFNLGMPTQNMRLTQTFSQPEVMVRSKCDVHPWMTAFIGVVPHPYFAVSGQGGEFALRNVPPGEYELEAWHEVFGRQSRTVKVTAGADLDVEFTFQPK